MNYSIISNRDTLHKKSTFCTDSEKGRIKCKKELKKTEEAIKIFEEMKRGEKENGRL